jgi:hypothetical protein
LVDAWVLAEPLPELTADPYLSPPPPDDPPDTVCAVLPDAPAMPRPYRLVTYASEAEARAAGASPTHFGHCGLCSTLADLAVFMRNNDMTAPVRACGTRTVCLDVCLSALSDPYNQPDGTLNPCLQCDEDQSGAVFKAVAGRTRRNSGLPNAICRPCTDVRPLVHVY